jgi:clan AA aspartic protease (TIGR02281 family)
MSQIFAASLTLTLTIFTATTGFAASDPQDTVHFVLDAHGAVVVPVFIDGQGPFRFMVDTGASASSVSQTLAARIGVAPIAKAEVITTAGRATLAVVRIPRVTVGTVVAEALLASVLPASVLEAAAAGLDGVLGQDFLGPHNYTLDYRRKTLSWNVNPDDERGTRLALLSRDARVLVELPQGGERTVLLVPDSGADGLVLFTRGGESPLALGALPGAARLDSAVGAREVTPVVVRQLKLGDITLRDQPAVIVGRNEADAPRGDGLLPLHHFRKVTFSAEGYIVLQR